MEAALKTTNFTNATVYNRLPDVEWADERLNSLDKTKILETLSEVIIKHKLENIIGIRLLHNHNIITENEIMVEREEFDSLGKNCLVTFANKYSTNTIYSCNTWQLIDNEFYPLEYSNDEMVVSAHDLMMQEKSFFQEFAQTLKYMQVEDILGPCIIRRNFYQKYKPIKPFILAETTDNKRRANILKFEDENKYDPETLIRTSWLAVKMDKPNDKAEARCNAYCFPAACIPITACVRDANGNHSSQTHHDRGRHTRTHSPGEA